MKTLHPKLQVLFLHLSNHPSTRHHTYTIRDGRIYISHKQYPTLAEHRNKPFVRIPTEGQCRLSVQFGCELDREHHPQRGGYFNWYFYLGQ